MSKMACSCGGIISNAAVPCPTEAWLLRDQDDEAYHEALARDIESFFEAVRTHQRNEWIARHFSSAHPVDLTDGDIVQDVLCLHERRTLLSVAECEQCGRLHVQREPGLNSYRSYAPDEGGYAAALQGRRETNDASNVSLPSRADADAR